MHCKTLITKGKHTQYGVKYFSSLGTKHYMYTAMWYIWQKI